MKKIIAYIISLAVAFMPTLAFSSSNLGGWSLSNPIAQGASVIYDGAKKTFINGKEAIKTGTAKITPPPSAVARALAKTAAGYALTVAVQEMLGAVDYVLDPANNSITYTKKSDPNTIPPSNQFYYTNGLDGKNYNSVFAACTGLATHFKGIYGDGFVSNPSPVGLKCNVLFGWDPSARWNNGYLANQMGNPAYDPTAEDDSRPTTIPLDSVAQNLINRAIAGDPAASAVVVDAAADIVNEAENDDQKARPIVNQLEQTAAHPTDETATAEGSATDVATDPVTGEPVETKKPFDFSMQFPVFCGWAPIVCESAQIVVDMPTFVEDYWKTKAKPTLVENWDLVKDWATDEPEFDAEEVEIQQPQEFDNSVFSKDRFSVSRQCPVAEQHTISLSGISVNFSFDLTPICTVLDFARPALVACSYLYAAYIVIGAARNG